MMQFPIQQKFKLSDSFVDEYKSKKANFGFNGLGEFVYMRTYSRLKGNGKNEAWFETVRRVVEGLYSIQRQHIEDYRLGWNQAKAQKSAQEMYDRIFNFKMLPPGRGLWAMGSPVIMERGLSEALFNCSFISTDNLDGDPGLPFANAMDFLMLGVGVGTDTLGAGKLTIQPQKEKEHVYTVPDTREGWVESLRLLINSYFGEPKYVFDYNQIRKEGEPIKTFGGVSAGEKPLKELHERVNKVLSENNSKPISIKNIADIMNSIGRAVVSGNVRRSAEILLGSPTNEFMDLKDYEKNPDRADIGWASNNTVFATLGMDYSEIVERIKNNGEPGIFWLENAKKYGRVRDSESDSKDKRVAGLNPCVTGDTLIALADGRGTARIDDLARDGKDVKVLTVENDRLVSKTMRNFRVTGYNLPIYKVSFSDGTYIKVTGNHKFILRDGSKKEALSLKPNDSIMSFSVFSYKKRGLEKISKCNYDDDGSYRFLQYQRWRQSEHRFIYEDFSGKHLGGIDVQIHHKDFNGRNNKISNLVAMTAKEHAFEHRDRMIGDNNPAIRLMNPKWKKKLHRATIGEKNGNAKDITNEQLRDFLISVTIEYKRALLFSEYRKFAKELNLPATWTNYRKEFFGSEARCAIKNIAAELNLPIKSRRLIEAEGKTDLPIKEINGHLFVIKYCEICNKEFLVSMSRREQAVCGIGCGNRLRYRLDGFEKQKRTFKKTIIQKQDILKEKQVEIYNDLLYYLNRQPSKKEWINTCKNKGVSYEISRMSSPFRTWDDLKTQAISTNHRVVFVEQCGTEDVYTGTVDDTHAFFAIGCPRTDSKGRKEMGYVLNSQCGEITLESGELCNLVEMFPNRHTDLEDFRKTIKFAYLAAKTVTLLNTGWAETNRVMLRNRRIGLSMTGIAQFIGKHSLFELKEWMREGYKTAESYDEIYSDWFAIPRSIKLTTIKPSGTVSLLAGATPGIHFPESNYYIRRVRLAKNSPYVNILKKSNYKLELAEEDSKNTLVVEFPISLGKDVKTINDVTMWEQLNLAAFAQEHWADNSVSATITFKNEEAKDIVTALNFFQFKLKAISFLPKVEDGAYPQMPYEKITEEKYLKLSSKLLPLDFSEMTNIDSTGEKYCDTEVCAI